MKMSFKIILTVTSLLVVLGCSVSWSPVSRSEQGQSTFAQLRTVDSPSETGSCVRTLDIVYSIRNSDPVASLEVARPIQSLDQLPERESAASPDAVLTMLSTRDDTVRLSGRDAFRTVNHQLRQHFVPQNDPASCYAASLTSIWRYLGMQADYGDFVLHEDLRCRGTRRENFSATYSEIVETAFFVASNGMRLRPMNESIVREIPGSRREIYFRQPVVGGTPATSQFMQIENSPVFGTRDTDRAEGSHAGNAAEGNIIGVDRNGRINLYRDYHWHAEGSLTGGYITPLKHTGEMITALLDGHGILVGLADPDGAHTFVISGIEYNPVVRGESLDSPYFSARSTILAVRVLDPARDSNPEYWLRDMDLFFERLEFAVSFQRNSI